MAADFFLKAKPLFGGGPGPTPPTPWTKTQLQDMQGDLMVWCPEVKRTDAELEIRAGARGIDAGWMWTLWIYRFKPADRQKFYDAIIRDGNTHVAINVARPDADGGYHNLAPMSQADVDGYGARIMAVHDELVARNLVPVWAGVAPAVPGVPEQPLAAGIDPGKALIVMSDWDNTGLAWAHIKYLAQVFTNPKTLIYFELPGPRTDPAGQYVPWPDPSGGDEPVVPGPGNGGAWLREVQKRFPGFMGVMHETPDPSDYPKVVEWLAAVRDWWRDVQQVRFETDTYWKFWDNLSHDGQRDFNDRLGRDCPWLKGFMSGGTTHPVVPTPSGDGHYDGYLAGSQLEMVNAPDFRSWPETTKLESVRFGLDDMYLVFDAQDRWPNVSFGIQYSIGLAVKINGQWYGNAPIELWKGKPGGGGQVQNDNVDGSGIGQVAKNWWYDGRWGILRGYQPKLGEEVGVFVVAGDARNAVCPVQERSNIVLVKFPAPNTEVTYTP